MGYYFIGKRFFFNRFFVFLSVSSFVKKTTERINTLQMNSELWQRPEFKDSGHSDTSASASYSEEMDNE